MTGSSPKPGDGFRYRRRVQFAETDLAGIVHFSWMFRYMEEAEHAAWRAAGMSIVPTRDSIGWPRITASFDFRNPLYFEDEFEVSVRIAARTRRTVQYAFTLTRGDTTIGTGTMTTTCVTKSPDGKMKAIELPSDVMDRLEAVLGIAAHRQAKGIRDKGKGKREKTKDKRKREYAPTSEAPRSTKQ